MGSFRPTFIVAAICLFGVATEAEPKTRCIEKMADIVFVLDSSTSIWIRHYREQLQFVAELVQSFGMENDNSQIRVGAISYSGRSHIEFSLDRYRDPLELKEAILDIPHRLGQTNTARALRLFKKLVESDLENNKGPTIAIVITDGYSSDPDATIREAGKLHDLGIVVYSIGVGNLTMYDMVELRAIASDPDHGVYTVSSYAALRNITQTFYVTDCEACDAAHPSDVIFMIDDDHYGEKKVKKIQKASYEVMKSAGTDGAFRFVTISSKCPPFGDCNSLVSLLRQLQFSLFPRASWQVRQVGIVFLDKTIDLYDSGIFAQARRVLFANIHLHAVIIGDGVDEIRVQDVLVPKDRIINVDSFESLPSVLPFLFANRFCIQRPGHGQSELSIS